MTREKCEGCVLVKQMCVCVYIYMCSRAFSAVRKVNAIYIYIWALE